MSRSLLLRKCGRAPKIASSGPAHQHAQKISPRNPQNKAEIGQSANSHFRLQIGFCDRPREATSLDGFVQAATPFVTFQTGKPKLWASSSRSLDPKLFTSRRSGDGSAHWLVDEMTLLAVRHVTTYRYRQPVSFGEHRVMFRPRDSYDQRLLDARIEIGPAPSAMRWIHDVFGNCVAIARFTKEASELRFESNIRLDHQPSNAPDFQMEDYAQTYPFAYSAEEMPDLMRAMERQYLDPDHQIHRWVQKFLHQGRPTRTGELLMTLTYAIKESFTYNRRSETGIQDPLTTLMLRSRDLP